MTDEIEFIIFGVATFVLGVLLSAMFVTMFLISPDQYEPATDYGYTCKWEQGEWHCIDLLDPRGPEPRPLPSPTEMPKPPPADDAHRIVQETCIRCHDHEGVIR